MSLRSNAVDRDACSSPFFHLVYRDRNLGPGLVVKAVVVDVEFGIWVGSAGSTESDADKVFAENIAEDRGAEGAIIAEDLIDDVLFA
jgi:hypothetical protein